MSKLRTRLTYANVMATIAVFLALGGGAYAAFKLPENSVGSKQIKADAVKSSKVGRLAARGRLQGGAATKGRQRRLVLAKRPDCKGPKGDTGPQGPGALSFDGQFPTDSARHQIALVNGVQVSIVCDPGNNSIRADVGATDTAHSFYGWGTRSSDGGPPAPAGVASPAGVPAFMYVIGGNRVEQDVVAHSTAPGDPVKWTRVDVLGIMGSMCNYHALIIPPS
jgi:hypothetical protein